MILVLFFRQFSSYQDSDVVFKMCWVVTIYGRKSFLLWKIFNTYLDERFKHCTKNFWNVILNAQIKNRTLNLIANKLKFRKITSSIIKRICTCKMKFFTAIQCVTQFIHTDRHIHTQFCAHLQHTFRF